MPAPTPSSGSAPSYDVPQERIASIEHPCIVKNFSNGFKSLGGEQQLKHVLEHDIQTGRISQPNHVGPVAGVSLRPHDPFAKKLSSTVNQTQNVLIKVTLPKRTGRKRKRGSDDPFADSPNVASHEDSITAAELLQRLRDNKDSYNIEAIGVIQDTHRFLDLPDFQVRGEDAPIMRELRDHAMESDYDRLKAFNVSFNPDINASAALPAPPSFVRSAQAKVNGCSELKRSVPNPINTAAKKQRPPSSYDGIPFNEMGIVLVTEDVPTGPPDSLPCQISQPVRSTIEALEGLLRNQPIISLRMFNAVKSGHTLVSLRAAIMHIGYYIHSGPWARTIIKYGVDPRKDPSTRVYQTITISTKEMSTDRIPSDRHAEASKTHIFDGKQLHAVSKFWHLCNLTDPTLQHIVQTNDIRSECDLQEFGWYHNGTIAKIRVLLRDKMQRLVNNHEPLPEDDYMRLAALPDDIKDFKDCDTSLFSDKPHLKMLCQAIARDAVSRTRGLSIADGEVSSRGDTVSIGQLDGAVDVPMDGEADDEDYVEE